MATPMTTAELLQLREQNLAAQAQRAEARAAREAYLEPYQQALRLARLEGATGYGARADALSQLAAAARDWDQRIAPVFTSIYDGREPATAAASAAPAVAPTAASSLAPIFIDGTAGMDVAPPALSAPSAPIPVDAVGPLVPGPTGTFQPPQSTTVAFSGGPPVAEALRMAPRAEPMPDLRAYGPNVRAPVRCDSGVCYPDIRSGNFYANAEQAGIARSVPFGGTEADRYAAERVRQRLLPGGAAGLARGEQAVRALSLQDLRTTPGYNEALAVATRNAGGNRAVGQAITDQYFFGHDPDLNLALIENDTSPLIDEASSRNAALALQIGDATQLNRLTEAALGVGYAGQAGGLPYGLAPDQPAVATLDTVIAGLPNQPEVYGIPATSAAGGVAAQIDRRDAANRAIQVANAASSASLIQQLRLLDQMERNSLESFEAKERIRAEVRARTGVTLSEEQLAALAAQARGQ